MNDAGRRRAEICTRERRTAAATAAGASAPAFAPVRILIPAACFPAAGSANSAIELTCDQLEQYAQNVQGWGDFCKGWQAED